MLVIYIRDVILNKQNLLMRNYLSSLIAILLMSCINSSLLAQSKTITGTITDNANNPINGAAVSLKGSKIATISDEKGNFTLQSSETKGTIVVTFIGYEKQEKCMYHCCEAFLREAISICSYIFF